MTSQIDLLGRPPIRKQAAPNADIEIVGPVFAELCKPLSAKGLFRAAKAARKGERDAMKRQRFERHK